MILKEDSTYEAILYYNDYAMIDDIVDRYLTRAWYATNRHGIIFPYEDYRVYHSRGSEFDLGSTNPINEEDIIHQLQTLKTFNLSVFRT